jgi:phosphoglycerol geranylgeranyltransferase
MTGPVEKHLLGCIGKERAIHLTLIDPEKITVDSASQLARKAEKCKTTAIMIGGSTSNSTSHLDSIVKAVKRTVRIPTILFPNNVTGISKCADAIWFMSLLNSSDPYFLVGAQVLGAPIVKKYGLEVLPLGYIIVGEGGTAGVVGKATPIPYSEVELAAAHALAAQYLGMRFVYLEAGSGACHPVPAAMIGAVRQVLDVPLIVGGGIRTREQAKIAVEAGADMVVTGNITEDDCAMDEFEKLVATVRERRKA